MMVGVVLSITLAIVELSLKQLELSLDSRDSEVAFQAANAGLECAQRISRQSSSTIKVGGIVSVDCFEKTSSVSAESPLVNLPSSGTPTNGDIYRYKSSVSWGSQPSSADDRCSEFDVITMVVQTDASGPVIIGGSGPNSLRNIFPGYGADTKTCSAGGICTLAVSRGYSAPCTAKATAGTLMRQILLEF